MNVLTDKVSFVNECCFKTHFTIKMKTEGLIWSVQLVRLAGFTRFLCFGVDLVGFNWISQVSLVGEVSPD